MVGVGAVFSGWQSRPAPRTRSVWPPRMTADGEVLPVAPRPTGVRRPPTCPITTRTLSARSTRDLERSTSPGRYYNWTYIVSGRRQCDDCACSKDKRNKEVNEVLPSKVRSAVD